MTLQETIINSISQMNTILGNPIITYNNEDYVCLPSSVGAQLILGEGGFAGEYDLTITISKALFTDEVYPKSQEKITYKDKQYRIKTVREDATGAIIRLFCESVDKGV